MSREGCDPYNWLNHGDVYAKSQEKNVIPLTALTMDIDMSREGWDPINWLKHEYLQAKSVIPLASLTMEQYMSRDGWNHINWFNKPHTLLYIF